MTTLADNLRAIPNGTARADELDAIADRYWRGLATLADYNEKYWPAFKWWRRHCGE